MGRGSQDRHRPTVDVQARKKGRIARACVRLLCARVQALCNNVQRAAAEMPPRFCTLALRSRGVYARTSSPAFSPDFTTWGAAGGAGGWGGDSEAAAAAASEVSGRA